MTECHICGETKLARACHHCHETVCNTHTLPENHDCEGIPISIPARRKETEIPKTESEEEKKTETTDRSASWYSPAIVRSKRQTKKTQNTQSSQRPKPESKTADELAANYCPGTGSDSGPDVNPDGSIAGEQTQPLTTESVTETPSLFQRVTSRIRKDALAIVTVALFFAILTLL